jgi:CelD/BcsL family acetyltransferase involved in cellulose biosynthesis
VSRALTTAAATTGAADDDGARDGGLRVLPVEDARWQAFVARSASASPFHDPAWTRVLSTAYGLRAFALLLQDETAGAPFIVARGVTGRPAWISLPYTDELPLLADTPEAQERFVSELAAFGRHAGARRLDLRTSVDGLGWRRDARAVLHELELQEDAEAVRRGFSKSQVVRNIKRAEREGVTVHSATGVDGMRAFYALHERTRRRQGVPVQPWRFFALIWEHMVAQGRATVLIAAHDGTPLAAALFLHQHGTTIYKFGASDPSGWDRRPNHAIFWQAIQQACARGDVRLDFGRTDLGQDGLRAFKSGWGAHERPLVYSSLEPAAAAGEEGLATRALAQVIRRGPSWAGRGLGAALYRFAAVR